MTVVVEGRTQKPTQAPVPTQGPVRGLRFEVVDDAGWAKAVRKVLSMLEEDLGVVVRIEGEEAPEVASEPALKTCGVCGQGTTEVEHSSALSADACAACWLVMDRLLGLFEGAMQKHTREFRGQLAQMVRDVRSGADEPSFYRGFE